MLQWTNTTSVISKYGTFSPFLFLPILFTVLPFNFVVSGVTSSKEYPVLILNAILFPILFKYILIEGLSIFSLYFFKIYLKLSWISDTEYDPSHNSNLSFYVGDDNLSLLLFYELFVCFHV